MTVKTMPHLQYLAMKLSFKCYYYYLDVDYDTYYGGIRDTVALLNIIPIRRLKVLMFVLSLPLTWSLL